MKVRLVDGKGKEGKEKRREGRREGQKEETNK